MAGPERGNTTAAGVRLGGLGGDDSVATLIGALRKAQRLLNHANECRTVVNGSADTIQSDITGGDHWRKTEYRTHNTQLDFGAFYGITSDPHQPRGCNLASLGSTHAIHQVVHGEIWSGQEA